MCHNNTPPPSSSDLKTRDSAISVLTPPRRKNRTKTRKPKFLSLRLQLSPNHHKPSSSPSPDEMTQQQQLNLFPLHPENLVDDKDMMHDDHNVALLFSSHGPATLNGLLEQESTTTTATTEEEEGLTRCPVDDRHGTSLLRKAMKRRNEEEEEERWVCYSEVTSYCSATTTESTATTTTFGLLSLKLDYEGILNAWSDKGPLFVAGETPHSIPPFPHRALPFHDPQVVWGNSESVVGKGREEGEEERGKSEKNMKGKEEEGWKKGQREASVLRYKEKRQSRLFSKRIRYEVRKLNAEKRPRMKGRFVKRD